jgi:hypothetical protein
LATWNSIVLPSAPRHFPDTVVPPPISFLASAVAFAGILIFEMISFPSAP